MGISLGGRSYSVHASDQSRDPYKP